MLPFGGHLRCSIGTRADLSLLFNLTQNTQKERAHAGYERIGCIGIRWRNGHWNTSAESGSRCVHSTVSRTTVSGTTEEIAVTRPSEEGTVAVGPSRSSETMEACAE